MKKVSIIIINWNGKDYLKTCLESLFKQEYQNIEVILVDNASKDGSVPFVKKYFKNIKVVVNKENLGFAEANNIGFKKCTGEYVLFLNNDTEVTKSFITNLVRTLEKDRFLACVQSKILLMDHREKLDAVGAFMTSTGFLYHYGIAKNDQPKYNKKIMLFTAKGACMMFKKTILDSLLVNENVFDTSYFAYFEETDLCMRVWLAGYKVEFVPSSVIYHKMGGTSTKLPSPFIQYHSFKNRINSYLKNLEFKTLIKLVPIHLVMCEIIAVIFIFMLKPKLALAINKAIFWNITNLSDTLNQRRYIHNIIKKKTDQSIFRKVKKDVPIRYYFYLLIGLDKYND